MHLESKLVPIFPNSPIYFHLSFQSNQTHTEGNNVMLVSTHCVGYSLCWFNFLPLSQSLCVLFLFCKLVVTVKSLLHCSWALLQICIPLITDLQDVYHRCVCEATHKSHGITILSLSRAEIFLLSTSITAEVLSVSLTP